MIIYIQIVNLESMKFPLLPLESLNKESFSKIGLRSRLFRKWLGVPVRIMGDYGWSMDFDTPQGIDAVEYGRVLEYPKRRNKSQTTRKPDLFR